MSALPSDEQLAAAGREQLGALHRLGSLAAHFGAQELDKQKGTFGYLTSEVDRFTGSVGQTFAAGGLLPPNYVQPKPPPSVGTVLIVGGLVTAGLVGSLVLLARGGRRG
ncbi:MAG TPA: hypothetical protein PKI03_02220 [Pseudomonadota bacterium]|nr:hypothetical protein [Pseudomonadota bacterium]